MMNLNILIRFEIWLNFRKYDLGQIFYVKVEKREEYVPRASYYISKLSYELP